ncbi:MAG: glycosyltransferase [Chryseolinea sp.]
MLGKLYLEWYAVWKFKNLDLPVPKKTWAIDVLTTYCAGEPKEMVINTLKAIQNIRYPHTTYLCDEDDDPELRQWCSELGVIHVTRDEKKDAKAGNINNTLSKYATGEICLILDPDHVPNEAFLDLLVGHFNDDKIGFVQAVQGYYNQDSTVIARAAAEQTYLFYGPIMMGLNALETVPAIGANCLFRRAALDSINGHAPGLTEDMHTAMLLHAKGWKSVYIPSVLNRGLVPWNFSGYCKQQIKWSRGTFDLMLHKFPRIFRNLTINQKIYYFSCGFFYTYGFKVLIDILLPILALFMVKVPLKVDIIDFYKHFIPFWVMGQFIRLYCQRWLMGEKERGLYLLGAILLKSSWWVSVAGFIYTVIGKKVPYIPTPKENTPETPWLILIPNFIVILVSLSAILYGLRADLNPYSIFMAFFALFNIATLGLGSMMAMQTWISKIHSILFNRISKHSWIRLQFYHFRMQLYRRAENGMPVLFFVAVVIFITAQFYFPNFQEVPGTLARHKDYGGMNSSGRLVVNNTKAKEYNLSRFDIHQNDTINDSVIDSLMFAVENGRIPFIYLQDSAVMLDSAHLSTTLGALTQYIREYSPMIFISLRRGEASEAVYYQNMLTLASSFASYGAGGIAWTWDYSPEQDSVNFIRSTSFVSWVLRNDKNFHTVDAPVLPGITADLPAIYFAENSAPIVRGTSDSLAVSLVVTNREVTRNQIAIASQHSTQLVKSIQPAKANLAESNSWNISGRKLRVGSKEIFIKGIAYNPGHDWQDDRFNVPLTRDKLREDFKAIKAMGANTIRRYSPGISDYNIFRVAEETDVNVLYGFWFDPKINYASDFDAISDYREEVLAKVRQHRSKTCIIGWSIGNETWGLLKHQYGEPYLTQVRRKYVEFIESLAQEIHGIDPSRPVFTMSEHTPMLVTELNMYEVMAPSIDIYGINSYYEQNLIQLDSLMRQFFPERNYLVSEFGPDGYWNNDYNLLDAKGRLIEPTAYEKAHLYESNWRRFVEAASDKNLGGVAFCWQDRFEGSSTWFGLTDIHGYKKPSYYALTEVWTGTKHRFALPNILISPNDKESVPGLHRFYATSPSGNRMYGFKFKWIVYDNTTFEKQFETSFSNKNYAELPTRLLIKTNRLYLYVTDLSGDVVTASINF